MMGESIEALFRRNSTFVFILPFAWPFSVIEEPSGSLEAARRDLIPIEVSSSSWSVSVSSLERVCAV